jgi:hypothetical protein
MIDIQSLLVFPPPNPWIVYFWLVIIATIVRGILVIGPAISLAAKFNPQGKFLYSEVIRLKNLMSIQGIEAFLIREFVLVVTPAAAAMAVRIVLGPPALDSWTDGSVVMMIAAGLAWFIVSMLRASRTRRNITTILNHKLAHPKLVVGGLKTLGWGRSKLDVISSEDGKDVERLLESRASASKTAEEGATEPLSELGDAQEIEPELIPVADNELVDSEAEKASDGRFDGVVEGAKAGASKFSQILLTKGKDMKELAGAAVRDLAAESKVKIDAAVQETVNKLTRPNIGLYLVDMGLSLGPLFLLYLVFPSL